MLDSQKNTDDQNGRQKVDAVVDALFNVFNANVFEKFVEELNLANLAENADEYDASYIHRLRAEAYKALLSITR